MTLDTTTNAGPDAEPEPFSRAFFFGLDLGQAQDYTAIAIVERLEIPINRREVSRLRRTRDGSGLLASTRCVIWDRLERRFLVRFLQRFRLGTSYPDIVARVTDLVNRRSLRGRTYLAVDSTGVGRPVVDMLRRARLPAPLSEITITGGDQVNGDWHHYRLPKRDLVSVIQVMLQERTLRIASTLAEAGTLTAELGNFEARISPRGHDTYGAAADWREGANDDLVLALAMACWLGSRPSHRIEAAW